MSETLRPMEEIRAMIKEKTAPTEEPVVEEKNGQAAESHAIVAQEDGKAITELSASDIRLKVDKSKSMEEQAEDIVGAMATAKAVQNEETARELTEKKSEELLAKAETKKKQAQTAETKAEVEKQEANRSKNEAVLQTFGINKHLPDWLLGIMVFIFSPIFIVLTIAIGVPCGIIKVFIDDIDNILVRYEAADAKNKPKIKVTVWIFLVLLVLAAATFIVLKCLGKI